MIPHPGSSWLESAAEELREGTPEWAVPGSAHDWRNQVADWLVEVAAQPVMVWRCDLPGNMDTPVGTPGFSPCPRCRKVARGR